MPARGYNSDMEKKELIEILTEHFPTKDEFSNLVRRVGNMEGSLEDVHEKLDVLTASSDALDHVFEQHPIERIERLESHTHLPAFSPTVRED